MTSPISYIVAIVLSCTLCLITAQSVCAQTGQGAMTKEQVLDRWAAARGGRTMLGNVHSVHLRGTIETGGLKGTFERWTTSNGELRMAVDVSAAFRQVQIFNSQSVGPTMPAEVFMIFRLVLLKCRSATRRAIRFSYPGACAVGLSVKI